MRKVKQNLAWAFGYNTAAIPLGAGILYPFFAQVVSPELAAFLMAISSLSVTLNAMSMRGFRPPIRRGGRPATGRPLIRVEAAWQEARETGRPLEELR